MNATMDRPRAGDAVKWMHCSYLLRGSLCRYIDGTTAICKTVEGVTMNVPVADLMRDGESMTDLERALGRARAALAVPRRGALTDILRDVVDAIEREQK